MMTKQKKENELWEDDDIRYVIDCRLEQLKMLPGESHPDRFRPSGIPDFVTAASNPASHRRTLGTRAEFPHQSGPCARYRHRVHAGL